MSTKEVETKRLVRKRTQVEYRLEVPDTDQLVSIELNVIPAGELPDLLQRNTNVVPINIGGKEFFLVAGKTVLVEP